MPSSACWRKPSALLGLGVVGGLLLASLVSLALNTSRPTEGFRPSTAADTTLAQREPAETTSPPVPAAASSATPEPTETPAVRAAGRDDHSPAPEAQSTDDPETRAEKPVLPAPPTPEKKTPTGEGYAEGYYVGSLDRKANTRREILLPASMVGVVYQRYGIAGGEEWLEAYNHGYEDGRAGRAPERGRLPDEEGEADAPEEKESDERTLVRESFKKALSGEDPEERATPEPPPSPFDPSTLGPFRLGMTRRDVQEILGEPGWISRFPSLTTPGPLYEAGGDLLELGGLGFLFGDGKGLVVAERGPRLVVAPQEIEKLYTVPEGVWESPLETLFAEPDPSGDAERLVADAVDAYGPPGIDTPEQRAWWWPETRTEVTLTLKSLPRNGVPVRAVLLRLYRPPLPEVRPPAAEQP